MKTELKIVVFTSLIFSLQEKEFACMCANFPIKFVFINPTFCAGSGVHFFQGWFCAYATVINEASDVAVTSPSSVRSTAERVRGRGRK